MGNYFSLNNNWTWTPYNNTFLNMPYFNFTIGGTSSSSSNSYESFEDYQKRIKEEVEAEQKKREANVKLYELKLEKEEIIAPLQKNIEDIKTTKNQIETSKNKDGSSTLRADTKKMGFWGKAARWGSNAVTSLANIGKGFIGIEQDGSWNWKKGLKNLAKTVAIIGGITAATAIAATFVPVLGPAIIGYGLAAVGLAGGAVGVAKGVKNLNEAKTEQEIDKAQQDICANAFIGITSAFGLRGIGKGLRASNPSAASSAAPKTSHLGKVGENLSNFGRDMTVNAWRGTKQAMSADKALIAAKGGGFGGFRRAYGSKVKDSWQSFNNWKSRFDKKYNEMETSLNNRITDLNNKIAAEANPAKRALLEEQKAYVENNLLELRSLGSRIKTKADYDKLMKDNSSTFNKEYVETYTKNPAGDYDFNGMQISAREFQVFKNQALKMQNMYNKELQKLIKTKENLMRNLANKPDKNAAELAEYIPSPNVARKWYKPLSYFKNDYQLAIGGKESGKWGEIMGLTLSAPATTAPKALGLIDMPYSSPMLLSQDMSKEETIQTLESIDQQIAALKEQINAIEKMDAAEFEKFKTAYEKELQA